MPSYIVSVHFSTLKCVEDGSAYASSKQSPVQLPGQRMTVAVLGVLYGI